MTWADTIKALAPGNLQDPIGLAKLGTIGDALEELVGSQGKIVQAVQARFPTLCDASVLPYLGNDRLIPQGVNEPVAAYRQRLRVAIPLWSTLAGTPWGTLKATLGCVSPVQPQVRHVTAGPAGGTASGWSTFDAGADTTQAPWYVDKTPQFDWDGASGDFADPAIGAADPWWRFWIIIYSTGAPWCAASGTWGSSVKKWGDPSKSWGFATPASVFNQIQQVIRQWKSNHAWCRWVIVSFDDTLFDPFQAMTPDGSWGRWSKIVNGQYVRARSTSARYFNV